MLEFKSSKGARKASAAVRQLQVGSERLQELLVVLRAGLHGHPNFANTEVDWAGTTAKGDAHLDEHEVYQLLGDPHLSEHVLSRLRELEDAAERWRAALARARAVLDDSYARGEGAGAARRTPPQPLCEADDPYWYL